MFARYLYKLTWVDLLLPFAVFTLIAFLFLDRRSLYLTWKYPKLRNFTYVPILGHLGMLRYINPSMKGFMQLGEYLAEDSGRLLQVLSFKALYIYKVEHLETILTHQNTQKKAPFYDFFKGFIGDSIFRISGKRWKENRKAMAPTMHADTIKHYTDDMCRHLEILSDKFHPKVGKTFDAMPDVAKCVIDMFVNTSFGIDIQMQKTETPFVHYTDEYLERAMFRIISLIKHPDFIYRWTNDYKFEQMAMQYGNDVTDRIFAERKAIYDEEQANAHLEVSLEEKAAKQRSRKFLDHLLDLNKETKFTDQEIRDEVNTFMIGGFDTSTSGVSFTLLALALFPAMQEKVYEEIIDVLGPERRIEYADLSKLTYTEKFIKESMRLFPPAPVMARVAEDEFPMDGHIVPKGTQLNISIMHTHRSPLYWEDPLTFDPERFSPEGSAKQLKYSYIPFSAGPRICFGTRVAWITLKASVATLIRRYKLTTPYKSVEDVKIVIKMTLKAEDGVLLRLEERNPTQN